MGEVVKDSSVMHVVSHYCVVDEVVEHPLGGLNDRFHGKLTVNFYARQTDSELFEFDGTFCTGMYGVTER